MNRSTTGVLVALLVAGAACTRAGERVGGGDEVDLCEGWAEVEALQVPDLDDADEVDAYTDAHLRVLGRIDTDEEVDDDPVPRAIVVALATVQDEMSEAAASGDPRVAAASLVRGPYGPAADRVTDFWQEACR